jgi:hypothetical protein
MHRNRFLNSSRFYGEEGQPDTHKQTYDHRGVWNSNKIVALLGAIQQDTMDSAVILNKEGVMMRYINTDPENRYAMIKIAIKNYCMPSFEFLVKNTEPIREIWDTCKKEYKKAWIRGLSEPILNKWIADCSKYDYLLMQLWKREPQHASFMWMVMRNYSIEQANIT